jgi:hypothetical protein
VLLSVLGAAGILKKSQNFQAFDENHSKMTKK